MPQDPNATHHGPSRMGGVAAPEYSAEFGTVLDAQVDRYTYTVRTQRGRALQGVPRKRSSPSDLAILPNGTSVLVRYDIGIPYIDGVLDMPATVSDSVGVSATDIEGYGGQGNNMGTNPYIGTYRGPNEPTDLLPGDDIRGNASGARVGVLEGGVALLKGGGLAQVRAFGLGDLLELISRSYRHVSDMGVSEIKNDGGRINWSFRGASDQTNEAGANEENWTIRIDLGAEGDLFDFRLTTPQGQDLFRFHVDSDGRVELFGSDGLVFRSGNRNQEPHIAEHEGDVRELLHGSRESETRGSEAATVLGDRTSTIDGSHTESVGVDAQRLATRDQSLAAGRNMYLTAVGAKDDSDAFKLYVPGGHAVTEVGSTSYPGANWGVKTLRGGLKLESTQGGKIQILTPTGELAAKARKMTFDTSTPDSVILGGSSLTSHVAKYEQLEQLLRTLMQLFDNHAHPGNGAPPTVRMSPVLTSMLQAVKSQRVGVGG